MQEMFNWSEEDITYVKQMERIGSLKSNLTAESRKILKEWLWADYMLYDYFVAKLKAKIKNFGTEKMAQRVASLNKANQQIMDKCVVIKDEKTNLRGEASRGMDNVYGYQINESRKWCWPYLRRETEFAKMIRQYQVDKAKWLQRLQGQESYWKISHVCGLMFLVTSPMRIKRWMDSSDETLKLK